MEPYLGTILTVAFDFAPAGWMRCEGQILQVTTYQALFSLLGNVYGGDGKTTFALPDLRGYAVAGVQGAPVDNAGPMKMGQKTGAQSVTVTSSFPQAVTATLGVANMPVDTLTGTIALAGLSLNSSLNATTKGPGAAAPVAGAMLSATGGGNGSGSVYYSNPTPAIPLPAVPLGSASVVTTLSGDASFSAAVSGSSQPLQLKVTATATVPVMQPTMGVTCLICVVGLYPPPSN